MKRKLSFKGHRLLIISIVILFIVVLLNTDTYAKEVRGVTDDAVTIGYSLDLTGPTATVQRPTLEAVRNYFNYINYQGGINGRKVRLIVEDNRYSVPIDIAVFKKLVFKDYTLALILACQEASVMAMLPQIKKHRVPSTIIGMNENVVVPTKRYVFLPVASYNDQIKVMFDYMMKDLKAKNPRIAFIAPDNSYGKTGWVMAQICAKHYGIPIVDREILSPGALEATSQVLNMKRAKPDYVISNNYVGNSVALLRDARKMKFSVPFLGIAPSSTDDIVKIAGKASQVYVGASPLNTWYSDTPGIRKMMKIHKKYSPGKEKVYRTQIHILAWVSAMTFAEGIKKAGKNLTPDTLVDAIERLKDFNTGDLSVSISYGPNMHKGGTSSIVFKADVEKGRLSPITGWRKPSF